jgi:hypothetical protein
LRDAAIARSRVLITIYADRRDHDVTGVAEALAESVADRVPSGEIALYLDRVVGERRSRRKRAPVRRALPANPLQVLSTAAERAEITIIGMWGPVTEQVITAFDLSRIVLLLTDSAVPSLRAAQRTLRLCAGLGYGADRIAVVLLTDGVEDSLDHTAIAGVLKREIYAAVPADGDPAAYQRLAARVIG